MDIVAALVLGIVQGLTEYLPVSSSAHVAIASQLIHAPAYMTGAAFTAIIQFGTEAAVIVYFWRDIVSIIGGWGGSVFGRGRWYDGKARPGWLIIIGTIPIGVLGLVFNNAIEGQLRNLYIVAISLIGFGLLLGAADRWAPRDKDFAHITWKDGLIYGLWQCLALVPGVSRSGGTITGGRLLGYDRPSAARFSFLLAIPAVLISGAYELVKSLSGTGMHELAPIPTAVSTVAAFLVGWFVISRLMRYLSRGSFAPFVYYRIVLGVLVLVALGTGILDPIAGL
jgi:undecaprenyl-diphosphatase